MGLQTVGKATTWLTNERNFTESKNKNSRVENIHRRGCVSGVCVATPVFAKL